MALNASFECNFLSRRLRPTHPAGAAALCGYTYSVSLDYGVTFREGVTLGRYTRVSPSAATLPVTLRRYTRAFH